MNEKIRGALAMTIVAVLMIHVAMGCGSSGGEGPSLQDIPRYPNATAGETMAHSIPGGFMGGSLEQYTTTDPFDQVLEFYQEALGKYDPEYVSHASELGRQTAISIRRDGGMTTVAIQEFTAEGTVNITFMTVGG